MDFTEHYNRPLTLQKAGDLHGAIAEINKALELSPNDYASWLKRGVLHDDLKNFLQAEADYSKCIEVFPSLDLIDKNSPNAMTFYRDILGCAYFNRGILRTWEFDREEEGRADWEKAIELGHEEAKINCHKQFGNSKQ